MEEIKGWERHQETARGALLLEAYTLCTLWQGFLLALQLQDGDLAGAESLNETNSGRKAGAFSATEITLSCR